MYSINAPRRRAQFLAGRWLVRRALVVRHGGVPCDWKLSANRNAAPTILRGPVGCTDKIGLTHSGDTVACVVSTCGLGIDLEGHDRRVLSVAELSDVVLTDAERKCWLESPSSWRQVEFLSQWTLKEAWFKLCRHGLGPAGFRGIEASLAVKNTANARQWREPGFTLSLVGLRADVPLHIATTAPASEALLWRVCDVDGESQRLYAPPAICSVDGP